MTALTDADLDRLEADAIAATEHHGTVWTAARMYAPAAEVLAITTLARRAQRMEPIMRELADDLDAEVKHRYLINGEVHPAQQRSYDNDMDVVNRARAILSEPSALHGGKPQ